MVCCHSDFFVMFDHLRVADNETERREWDDARCGNESVCRRWGIPRKRVRTQRCLIIRNKLRAKQLEQVAWMKDERMRTQMQSNTHRCINGSQAEWEGGDGWNPIHKIFHLFRDVPTPHVNIHGLLEKQILTSKSAAVDRCLVFPS